MSTPRIRMSLAVMGALSAVLFFSASAWASEQLAFLPASFSPFGPTGPGTFSYPTGIAVNESAGELFVADDGSANTVDIFNAQTGVLSGSITGTGSESFDFGGIEPAGVAVDSSSGVLYVSDVKHNVVDKFKRTGPATYKYECQFSGWYGVGAEACPVGGGAHAEEEAFREPLGVAVDSHGDVYIADYGTGRGAGVIDEFDPAGKGILRIAEASHSALNGNPKYVAVDAKGDIFALNDENGSEVVEFRRSSLIGVVEGEESFERGVKAIILDPAGEEDLFVENSTDIGRYMPLSSKKPVLESEFGAGVFSNPQGLAFDDATQAIYTTDAGGLSVDVFAGKKVHVPEIKGGCTTSNVSASGATLHDEVDPEEASGASYTFEYGPTSSPFVFNAGGSVSGNAYIPVTTEASGLEPGALYHCRVSATATEASEGGISAHGPDSTFETQPLPPAAEAPAASEITTESAVLGGAVNPGSSSINPGSNAAARAHFEYGPAPGDYTHSLPSFGVGVGTEPIAVEQAIPTGSLQPDTTYHFVLVASNATSEMSSSEGEFTTLPLIKPHGSSPADETGAATAIGLNNATLGGSVATGGLPTVYQFEFGSTAAYGTVLLGGELSGEQGEVAVSQEVADLLPGTTYHYRVVAFNAVETAYGPDRTFTTASPSAGTAQPPTLPLLTTPVFPIVKYPPLKIPKKHVKHKKKPRKAKHPSGRRKSHAGRR
jgi:DNA-binding beta-propeller fold protein YncE